ARAPPTPEATAAETCARGRAPAQVDFTLHLRPEAASQDGYRVAEERSICVAAPGDTTVLSAVRRRGQGENTTAGRAAGKRSTTWGCPVDGSFDILSLQGRDYKRGFRDATALTGDRAVRVGGWATAPISLHPRCLL
ncbi:unnamed protein product, partial [Effrenium voratum]